MVKVIERGENPDEKPREIKCSKCKSKLEYMLHEREMQRAEYNGTDYYITCPVCKGRVFTDVSRVYDR